MGYSIVKLKDPQLFFNYYGYNQVTTYTSRSSSTTRYYVVPMVEQGDAITEKNPVSVFINDVNPGSFFNLQNKLNGMRWVRKWDCNLPALQDAMGQLDRAKVPVAFQGGSICVQYDQGPEGTLSMSYSYQTAGIIMYVFGTLHLLLCVCISSGLTIFMASAASA